MLTKNESNLIRHAIISIYLHFARIQHTSKKEIEIINNMLKPILGEDTSQQEISKFIEKLYSIRQSTNILKRYLNLSDKIKLLLNLFYITYFQNDDFKVLGGLEIIKIVDLLYIDINIYDKILDILEKKSGYINISLNIFIENRKEDIFSNLITLGNFEHNDVYLVDKEDSKIAFLVFEKMILIGFENCTDVKLNEDKLTENRFYLINEKDIVNISNLEHNISLTFNNIKNLYESSISQSQKTIHIYDDEVNFDILYNGCKVLLSLNQGHLIINEKKIKDKKYIALNDQIIFTNDISGLDILCGNLQIHTQKEKIGDQYLESFEKFFRFTKEKTSKTLAKFKKEDNNVFIEPVRKDIFLNNRSLTEKTEFFLNKDIISFEKKNLKINKYFEILKIEYEINELKISNLFHSFKDGHKALDGVSFSIKKNKLMAIIGPSGSGKTTLLKTLIKDIIPNEAQMKIDNYDLYTNFNFFQKYIGYVPQDDLLFSNLTVYENLYFNARLRLSHINDREEIDKRITNILKQIRLDEKRNTKVGDVLHKSLSGGQRKRLNVALELLADPLIIILDEPTSGLSSKDSEKLINMLNELKEQGKIIIATIHQPNSDIFQKFDKILFLDKNGTQVFYGNTSEVFDYFDDELKQLDIANEELNSKKNLRMPEYLFDILEYPIEEFASSFKLSNDKSQIENRKFPPKYWKEKFNKAKLFELISKKETYISKQIHDSVDETKLSKSKLTTKELVTQFYYILNRNLKNKLTNQINLMITFVVAPILSFLVSFILRFNQPETVYTFYDNENIFMFIFISIIIFIFLGLANSLDEILSEKRIILREKKLNIKSLPFLISKNITLALFTLIQSILYMIFAVFILKIYGAFIVYTLFLFLSGVIGFSIGLLASSFIQDRKAVINILPLVLIPQIMFAGAVIKFEKMNSRLKINPNSTIPEFCELIPAKWLMEGLVVSQAKLNFYDIKLNKINNYRKKVTTSENRKISNYKMNEFIKKYDSKKYRNSEIKKAVDNQDGESILNRKNYFLSSKKKIFGSDCTTAHYNIIIILLMILIINLITYIKLTYFYDEG
ncbi:MAG: ATP-binding cassette domain-containing protein [Candidatus Cloacimonetes bacterium]|nr:ATP-binding cassette domain-containing protein [Candidatus Cloacimonadota bacterium]